MKLPTEEGYYWVKFKNLRWNIIELRTNYDGKLSQVEDTCYGPMYIPIERYFSEGDKIVGPIKEPDQND